MRTRQSQPFPIDPAASQSLSLVKRQRSWRIWSVRASVISSAAPGNRSLVLQASDGAGNVLVQFASAEFAGTVSIIGFWSPSGAENRIVAAGTVAIAIPIDLWIQPIWTVTVFIQNAQAGDALQGSVMFVYDEFLPDKALRAPESLPDS